MNEAAQGERPLESWQCILSLPADNGLLAMVVDISREAAASRLQISSHHFDDAPSYDLSLSLLEDRLKRAPESRNAFEGGCEQASWSVTSAEAADLVSASRCIRHSLFAQTPEDMKAALSARPPNAVQETVQILYPSHCIALRASFANDMYFSWLLTFDENDAACRAWYSSIVGDERRPAPPLHPREKPADSACHDAEIYRALLEASLRCAEQKPVEFSITWDLC
ncbi:MAG TPA: hypothetical protein VEK08_13605 [Planctomycetota bacterium]|nr:hypothetical protein [Planctomycetota bacterium]